MSMQARKLTYEEIEPFCRKVPEITEVHVQGFKKEHLNVQLNNLGKVVITGDCPLDETRGIKFRKELTIPDDCKRNDIRAKLTGGILYISMPRNSQQQPYQEHRHVLDGKTALKLGALAAGAVAVGAGAYLACKRHN